MAFFFSFYVFQFLRFYVSTFSVARGVVFSNGIGRAAIFPPGDEGRERIDRSELTMILAVENHTCL